MKSRDRQEQRREAAPRVMRRGPQWREGQALGSEERTELIVKYCDTIKSFGYEPLIYASRDMLIAGLLPDKLADYDIWLSDDYKPEKGTDYPYRFSMWQYTKKGKVDGIEGDVDLNLRFINNKEK